MRRRTTAQALAQRSRIVLKCADGHSIMEVSRRLRVAPDTTGPGKLLFAFFAAMAETERKNIRESTLEGLDTAARKGKHGGRPPVITDDMLHTVLRRRAGGESVEQIQPDLIIPTGKRKGQNPSVASIYRALAEHAKHEAYPEAVEQAHADFTALQMGEVPGPRPATPDRVSL
ncbi:recombinase family protein [Streptomyces sp. NPDC054995]